jgi:hypothetical protein
LRPEVPKELEAVINTMMAKESDQRYQEPWEVVEALQPWTEEPIDPPAAEEMPRLCPALEQYSTANTAGPNSGSMSGVRRALRNGPRTGSSHRLPQPRGAGIRLSRNQWIGVSVGAAVAILGLAALIFWLTRSDEPNKSGPIRPNIVQPQTPPDAPPGEPKDLPQIPGGSDR